MKPFDAVVARLRAGYGLIEAFHTTQETYGYLPRQVLEGITSELSLPLSRVYGVATFYTQFRLKPIGKYVIDVCMGTACHVASTRSSSKLSPQELEIPVGETTQDRLFTLRTVNCVGACALAPVVRIGDDETHGRMTQRTRRASLSVNGSAGERRPHGNRHTPNVLAASWFSYVLLSVFHSMRLLCALGLV